MTTKLAAQRTIFRSHKLNNNISVLIILITIGLQGCTPQPRPGYFKEYDSAIKELDHLSAQNISNNQDFEKKFASMKSLFSDLKHPNLEQRARETYATSLYFNDTLHTYRTLDEVVDYLVETANRVTETKVQFEEFSQSDESYFVRWKMDIKFLVNGKIIETSSVGVSQIKFDDNGKIVFHQDFWDNTEGFFRHLPVVGQVLNKTLDRL